MRRLLVLVCAALLCGLFAAARPHRLVTVCPGFLPENDMKIPVGIKSVGGISQAQYNEVMDRLEAIYKPIVKAKGGVLVVNRMWEDATVNSSAQRQGNKYVLNMYGGLARHPAITQDGETLVACHEMAHHLGGAPKMSGWFGAWATIEGQSDYAANLKCMRLMFSDSGSAKFTRLAAADPVAQKACKQVYKDSKKAALCLRVATAGLSVTSLFKIMHNETQDAAFDTPDPAVVAETSEDHPATQCRLDTYLQSALCSKPVSEALDDEDPSPGACTAAQGYRVGLRPLCWYKPTPAEGGGQLFSRASVAPKLGEAVSRSPALSSLQGSSVWQGL
ncbi:MAG: hypothetical protein PHU21_11835 [Elusimicrobia bacterium]|nr:hypothetical protein [Elusimicrobiota bacterium]